jgi:hypothetical protein
MERKTFINSDPLTGIIINFLRGNMNQSFSIEEIQRNIMGTVSAKQVQLVMNLLMQEGMVRVNSKDGKAAYQIKTE